MSICFILKHNACPWPFIITTADNILLTPEHIESFISQAQSMDGSFAVGMVKKELVIKAFPNTKRTWYRFSDAIISGCNLYFSKDDRVIKLLLFWRSIEANRKKVVKLLWALGTRFWILKMCGKFSLDWAFKRISHNFGVPISPLFFNDGSLAVDADKIEDVELIQSYLCRQEK